MSTVQNNDVNERLEWLENGLREIGKMCLRLGGDDSPRPTAADDENGPPIAAATGAPATGGLPLREFLKNVPPLPPADRLTVVNAAIAMLEGVFVHLPLKRAMHGIDPLQQLRLLRYRLSAQIKTGTVDKSDRGFHDEMIAIFHSLRDLHTNYMLPASYRGKTAFLPFLVEEYFEDGGTANYIVTKVMPGFTHATFVPEVKVTHWNGIPIERAIELNAAREAGSNGDARHARGLEALTLRPMVLTAPPDEAWVIIGYQSGGQALETRFEWQVMQPQPSENGADTDDPTAVGGIASRVMGFDAETEAVRRARKSIFEPVAMERERRMAQVVTAAAMGAGVVPPANMAGSAAADPRVFSYDAKSEAIRQGKKALLFPSHTNAEEGLRAAQNVAEATRAAEGGVPGAAGPQNVSLLPDFFTFRPVNTSRGTFGYIRIYSFMAYDEAAFVAEFARIAKLLPQNGLIIDVRGNGGGNINAGEHVLQILTTKTIHPERFHFINTAATLTLCDDPTLTSWKSSIDGAVQTGEQYSQGFPLTDMNDLTVAYRYPGKLVLIIDALCYSTTDIFAAGFQDHDIGRILGTSGCTGAGGANVWPYEFFQGVLNFPALPQGMNLRTAIRRSTRVGPKAGVPLEDLGVVPDKRHRMTRRDVLQNNVDLIESAAQLF